MDSGLSNQEINRLTQLAQSKEGQDLIHMLSEKKSSQINEAVASGDKDRLQQLIKEFLSSPEAIEIKKKMGASNG